MLHIGQITIRLHCYLGVLGSRRDLFANNKDFVEKWSSVLEKCSFDLILLIIEQRNKELVTINEIIIKLKDTL